MSGNRLIGLVVAAVVVVALILFGVYHFRASAPTTEPKPEAEKSEPAPEAPKAEGEAAPGAEAEPPKTAAQVPSFDVVRIEGTGEGVIAGRAEPGWTVRVESNGNTIAETKVDEDGAFSIVLDKPLSAGEHALSLRAISPDGTRALTAQQPVKVAVGEAAPPAEVAAAEPEKPKEVEEAAKPQEKPARPVVFKDVQYEDTGPDSGKLTIAGEGDPGASILLFFDDEPLGQVTIGPDGTWSFEADTKVDRKDHTLRADLIQAGTGVVVGRTAAAFRRTEQVAVSAQPQPVYPDGPPPEAAPPPPTSMAAAEPPSLASQPQPVYPEGSPLAGAAPAAPATAVAEAEPSLASQPQPVYPEGAPEGVMPPEEEMAAELTARAQPEPVYPEGPPPAAPAPSYPVASAEPPSVANQPQPVYPPEPTEPAVAPATEVAAAEPPSVETQPQPVFPQEPPSVETQPQPVYPPEPAVEAEQPAVTAERPTEAPRAHEQPMIVFRSVDYQETGADTGKVGLSGTGDPGARIRLFLDNEPLGEVTVGDDGNWSFQTETRLATGDHTFRADRIDAETGAVIGRASIGMARMEPAPKVAAQEPEPSPPAAEPEAPPEEEMAAAEEAAPAPVAKKKAKPRSRIYTVRRGDTLWDIAEYYYGGGWRYRAIVRENRRKIKDPHWIYPRQKFRIPPRG